jgi:transposase InsO family protein
MAQDPLKVAMWRFEQIAPLLDHCLSPTQRSLLVDQMTSVATRWPSGRQAPITRATLYSWLKRCGADRRIESLMPAKRKALSLPPRVKAEWIEFALGLVEEEPGRSLYILARRIQTRFSLSAPPSRSSLQRALAKQHRYSKARRLQHQPRRTHFVAANVHQIWQGDAKADFTVTFTDGASRKLRILSLLDDCSRFVLAALAVDSESLPAVCKTFYDAASRFGLPEAFYADRGSPYDSYVFRQALAMLGVRRINTRPRNASAHGKIEAYHRSLQRWFIKELSHQPLTDTAHLQALLDAFIDQLYNRHYHRELKRSPHEAFNNAISQRTVSLDRLRQAFFKTSLQLPHPKTGTVRVNGRLWKVPSDCLIPRRQLRVAQDMLDPSVVYLLDARGHRIVLQPAVRVADTKTSPAATEYPAGSLSPLLEQYRGRTLPRATAGFGLPEIYQRFAVVAGRPVPDTEAEATLILTWLKEHGPFEPGRFNDAVDVAVKQLGGGRSLGQLLDELTRRIRASKQNMVRQGAPTKEDSHEL